MKLTTLREIFTNSSSFLDKEVSIGGWVRSNRDSKAFGFLMISDGTFFEQIQIVYHDSLANFSDITKDRGSFILRLSVAKEKAYS